MNSTMSQLMRDGADNKFQQKLNWKSINWPLTQCDGEITADCCNAINVSHEN